MMTHRSRYITLVGFKNFSGSKVFDIGTIIKLVKEPKNKFDTEAIYVEVRHVGKAAYVANSIYTVVKGTMSAGRVYDRFNEITFAEVKFIKDDMIIARLLSEKRIKKLKNDPESDLYYLLGD